MRLHFLLLTSRFCDPIYPTNNFLKTKDKQVTRREIDELDDLV